MTIRDVRTDDLPAVLRLNQGAMPHLSGSTGAELARFAEIAAYFRVTEGGGGIVAFLIALRPGAPYDSPNYRWFEERYDDFVYIDRIAVDPAARRRGVASALYGDLEAFAKGSPRLTCEVNSRPANDVSRRFHERHGFREVGTQDTEGGRKSVWLLEKALGE